MSLNTNYGISERSFYFNGVTNSDNSSNYYTRAVLRLECSLDCLSAPTYRYIAPRMIQRIILKFCGYVGCDDATNVSNFGYEPIKFNQLNQ